MRWWMALGLLIGILLPVSVWPCDLHPIPEHEKGMISVAPLEESGLYGFWYDLDNDGIADFALIYQMDIDGNYSAWPLFYFKNIDRLGRAEEVWVDRGGMGECQDIQLYYKRTVQRR